MDLSWIEKLQIPGLILAGMVIWLLFKLIMKGLDFCMGLLQQVSEQRTVLTEVVTLLRQLCFRVKGGGQE